MAEINVKELNVEFNTKSKLAFDIYIVSLEGLVKRWKEYSDKWGDPQFYVCAVQLEEVIEEIKK